MSETGRSLIFVLSAALLLAACSAGPSPAIDTPIPIMELNTPSDLPESTQAVTPECQPIPELLDGLAASLPFPQAVVMQQSYGGEDSLNIWLVSPDLDQAAFEQKQPLAEQQAVLAASTLLGTSDCLLDYETMHLTVVDSGYLLWFSGSLRTVDIPDQPTAPEGGGGGDAAQGGGREAPAGDSLPSGSCPWSEAAQNLKEDFSARQIAAWFTFVRDAGGNNVSAQWAVPDQQAALETLNSLPQITSQVSCVHPPVTGISVLLTLPDGQTLLTGYQPIQDGKSMDPAEFDYQFIEQP